MSGPSFQSAATDSCGCALSAKVMIVAFVASAVYYGWQLAAGEVSFGGFVARVVAITFVAATIGKVVGILRYRRRSKGRFRSAL